MFFLIDQLSLSIHNVPDTDICQSSLSLREGLVHQPRLDSIVQDTMKLLMLIGNAIVDINYSYPLLKLHIAL